MKFLRRLGHACARAFNLVFILILVALPIPLPAFVPGLIRTSRKRAAVTQMDHKR